MVSEKALVASSVVLSVALACTSAYAGGWFWPIVAALNIIMICLPRIKGLGVVYSKQLLACMVVPSLLQICLVAASSTTHFLDGMVWAQAPAYEYISAVFMSLICYVNGIMFITCMYRASVLNISRRWGLLLSMMYALGISVVSLFFEFAYLYSQGYPMFNADVSATMNRISNNLMMVAPVVFTFATAIYSVIATRLTRGKTLDVFVTEVE